MPDDLPTDRAPKPSVSDQLKTVATNPLTPVIALVTAITGAIGAWQAYQGSQSTARLSYDTLAAARVTDSARIDGCYEGLEKLRVWNQDLSDRIDRRAATTAQAIARKVTKAAAPPIATPPPEPAPKAPPVPVVPEPTALPAFDALAKKASP